MRRGFPQRLGKVFDFSTVPTRRNRRPVHPFSRGPIHLKPAGLLSEEWGARQDEVPSSPFCQPAAPHQLLPGSSKEWTSASINPCRLSAIW